VHERKQAVWIILNFHVNVKFNVLVLRLIFVRQCEQPGSGEDMTYLHEELEGFDERRDGLLRLFDGPDVFQSVLTIPDTLFNVAWPPMFSIVHPLPTRTIPVESVVRDSSGQNLSANATDEKVQYTWIMEHNNNVVLRTVHVCQYGYTIKGYAPIRENYRSRCLLLHHGWQLQSLRACSPGTTRMPLG
jgi:hypothetical protein